MSFKQGVNKNKNNMKRFLLLSISLLITFGSFSQNYKSNVKEAEKIKRIDNSFWVESGVCSDLKTAKENALKYLIDNIYENCGKDMVALKGEFESDVNSKVLFGLLKEDIESYSQTIILENGEKVNVFKYLKKEDFSKICDEREKLIFYQCNKGLDIDNEYIYESIGEALRYYYWSLALCYTHPYGAKIMFEDPVTNNEIILVDWLYNRIDDILGGISFNPKKKPIFKNNHSVAYEFSVIYGGNSIQWLNYTYNDGNNDIDSSVESGMASVELIDKDINQFDILVDIESLKEASIIANEAYSVMKLLGAQMYFASALKTVNVKKVKDIQDKIKYQSTEVVEKNVETEKIISESQPAEQNDFEKSMKTIESAIRNKKIDKARDCFTIEGFEMFKSLLNNGDYYILGKPEYKFLEYKDHIICRSIPMQFNFRNNVGFIRNVVFRFDKKQNKVSSIAFRLTDIAEMDIMGMSDWKSESRMILINFLEDYQTAYALKRIDYIDKIFSNDALIIVGTVLKQKKKSDNIQMLEQARIKYDTLGKGKYIEKLHKVFNSNEFVNIRFLENDIAQHNSGTELYGIRIKQEYISSSYGDIGYLFLMVDLTDELPVIYVRTWEPNETEEPISFDSFDVKII